MFQEEGRVVRIQIKNIIKQIQLKMPIDIRDNYPYGANWQRSFVVVSVLAVCSVL